MNIAKLHIFIALFMLIVSFPLFSQSNEYLDTILSGEAVSLNDTAYLILLSKDGDTAGGQPENIQALLMEKYRIDGQGLTRAKDLARLCMTEYQFGGGILFRVTKSSRYAFRDMKFLGLLGTVNNPDQVLSPEEVLRIIGNSHETWRARQ